MPIQIAHSSGGWIAWVLCKQVSLSTLLLCILAANLPDIDYALGYLAGNVAAIHRTFTHSLVSAFIAPTALWLVFIRHSGSKGWGALFISYLSHLVFDCLQTSGGGCELLWPIDIHRYCSYLFYFDEHYIVAWDYRSILGNLYLAIFELIRSAPLWVLGYVVIRYRRNVCT